jgi:hypothetical protein
MDPDRDDASSTLVGIGGQLAELAHITHDLRLDRLAPTVSVNGDKVDNWAHTGVGGAEGWCEEIARCRQPTAAEDRSSPAQPAPSRASTWSATHPLHVHQSAVRCNSTPLVQHCAFHG